MRSLRSAMRRSSSTPLDHLPPVPGEIKVQKATVSDPVLSSEVFAKRGRPRIRLAPRVRLNLSKRRGSHARPEGWTTRLAQRRTVRARLRHRLESELIRWAEIVRAERGSGQSHASTLSLIGEQRGIRAGGQR